MLNVIDENLFIFVFSSKIITYISLKIYLKSQLQALYHQIINIRNRLHIDINAGETD
jgi:hypothetical protein